MKGRKQISSRLLKSSTATVYQFVFSLWKSYNLSATVQICIIYLWFLISLTNDKIFKFLLYSSYCTELYKGTCDSLYSGWAATPGWGVINRASARECSPKFPLSATQILAKARSVEIASVWWFVSQLVVKNLNGISNFTWQMRLIFRLSFICHQSKYSDMFASW